MITTYCFFEPREILLCKELSLVLFPFTCSFSLAVSVLVCLSLSYPFLVLVCFYCFDHDKSGFVSVDDLNNLMNMVHNIQKGKTVSGTVKASWVKLEFKGDQLEFNELRKIHDAFPRLFEPAFRLQQNMMIHTLGEVWWTLKKRSLQDVKDLSKAKMEQMKAKKEAKKQRKKNRKIKRNMGLIKYYLCPCLRRQYDPELSEYDKLNAAQKAEMDKQMAIARRQQELKIKNPETIHWLKYQEKVGKDLELLEKKEKGQNEAEDAAVEEEKVVATSNQLKHQVQDKNGGTATESETVQSKETAEKSKNNAKTFLEEKTNATARSREERAYLRNERKKERSREQTKEKLF
jgi:hypothetical protein